MSHAGDRVIVTVYRARKSLLPEQLDKYQRFARILGSAVKDIPGFVSVKRFSAEDGEVCTIVELEDMEALKRWRDHPVHLKAKEFGKDFFSEYNTKVCELSCQLKKLSRDPDDS
jgi:heme-degrading monooxygenase HmoA